MPMDIQIKPASSFKSKKLKLKEQYSFLNNLNRLLGNGYPLIDALTIIHWDKKWSKLAADILETLKEGKTIDEALDKKHFNHKIVSYLHLSRTNGDLESTIKQCCSMLYQQMKNMKKFQQTIRYPIILFLLFIVLLYFVRGSIYPSFSQLLLTMNQSTPLTELSSTVINWLFDSLSFVFFLSLFGIIAWLSLKFKLSTHSKIIVYSYFPILRKYKRLSITCLFSLQIASLLKAGFTLKEALMTLKNQTKPSIVSYYATFLLNELEKGNHLLTILPKCQLFEKELISVFSKSTNNQTLQKDLNVYAEFLMDSMQEKIMRVLTLIQPIFFILLALLIILLYLSIMLPMFQLIQKM